MATEFRGRREDPRLVTGAGRYTADWSLPGQARAVFLRSDLAHARISGIDTSAALEAPGVLAVLTGADALAAKYFRTRPIMPVKGARGPMVVAQQPVLAADRVRYVGEPVALIVAETEAQARDAAELVAVDYEPLDAVSDPAAALAEGAPQLHDEYPDNCVFEHHYGDAAAVEDAFATAAHIARVELDSARVAANPMEPKAALAAWTDDKLDLYAPSQGITAMRNHMAGATGLPHDTFRPVAQDVGGAFGVRGDAYPEYLALALAAKQLDRPVKWVGTRSETFVSDMQGRGIRMVAELALDAEGRFLAIRHDWIADLGGIPGGAGPFTAVFNASVMACGAYRIPAIAGRTRLAVTNRIPITAYRGAARPEMAYVVERLVDEAARVSGLDRVALRRTNLIPRSGFPHRITTALAPSEYDSGDFDRLLDAGLEAAAWDDFEDRRAEAKARGRLRGIGCALFIEPAGGVAPVDEVAITYDDDGGWILDQVSQASGQGYETVFPEIVGRVLQIPPERLRVRFATADTPAQKGGGAFGSRSLMTQGSVFDEAARLLLARARTLAAEALDAEEDELDYAEGIYRVRGANRAISIEEMALHYPGALDVIAELPSPRAFPSGMHVAEVEIDPETGTVALENYVSVDDCGTVINDTLVRGQIWGGLLQGLGQVFGEAVAYDDEGQLLSGSFMDYMMPRAGLVPRVAILFEGVPSPGNRLGAKGVGESGTVGALPTAMNAIVDALVPAGVRALDMPATPHRIWQALQAARAG